MESKKVVIGIPHGRDNTEKLKDLLDTLVKTVEYNTVIATSNKEKVEETIGEDYRERVKVVDENDFGRLVDASNLGDEEKRILKANISMNDYGGARNILMAFAAANHSKYLLFLDDDVMPRKNYFSVVLEHLSKDSVGATTGQYVQDNVVSLEWVRKIINWGYNKKVRERKKIKRGARPGKNNGDEVCDILLGKYSRDSGIEKYATNADYALGGVYGIKSATFSIPFPSFRSSVPMRGEDDIHAYLVKMEGLGVRRIPAIADHYPYERNWDSLLNALKGDFVGCVFDEYIKQIGQPVEYSVDDSLLVRIYEEKKIIFNKYIQEVKSKTRTYDNKRDTFRCSTMIRICMDSLYNFINNEAENVIKNYINAYLEMYKPWREFIEYLKTGN